MLRLLQRILWFGFRLALAVRYKVRVAGGEKLAHLDGPTLVMPNHAAFLDPVIVEAHLHRWFPGQLRPITTTSVFHSPIFYPFMKLIGAIEVPNLDRQSGRAKTQTYAMIDRLAGEIGQGNSFLLYPSGRLQVSGEEYIGGARTAAELLSRCEDLNIVLVRTRGLWGSRFSRAWTGFSPKMLKQSPRAIGWAFANLLFFMPRRRVDLTVEVVSREQLPELDRKILNPWLDAWYNAENVLPHEQPRFVPYHFLFRNQSHSYPSSVTIRAVDLEKIPLSLRDEVKEMVESHIGRPLNEAENQSDMPLSDLELDSLDRMALALEIEQRFSFRSDDVGESLGQLWALAAGQNVGDKKSTATRVPKAWFREARSDHQFKPLGKTVAESFVLQAMEVPDQPAVGDELSGLLTFRKLLVASTLMERRFAELEGEPVVGPIHPDKNLADVVESQAGQTPIGLMLPASVAADIAFFGLHMAGKLPVMLNWTTGVANMDHAVRLLGLKYVVTSRKFIDRLQIDIPGVEYIFLEDIRATIKKREAITLLLKTYFAPRSFLNRLPSVDRDAPAVVLFTSGSDAAPKAVPLSHRNLFTNLADTAEQVQLRADEALISFLPPFHSFGLTLDTLLPILLGARLIHHADPTDATTIVRLCRDYRPSVLLATPTLMRYFYEAGEPSDFDSLRLVVLGGEKVPKSIFESTKKMVPDALLLEGYGVTECSPLISGNLPGAIRDGSIGRPMKSVNMMLVHPETHEPVPDGETGMLVVRGPSVFAGYLNDPKGEQEIKSPFLKIGDQHWYVTGDLVSIDPDGYYFFHGRLRRFLKVGGEMVSLPALEEPLANRFQPDENGPRVAVEGTDHEGQRRIVLFSTIDIGLQDANRILSEAGFTGIMRLDAVRKIDEIPLLGTGKTDYKLLRREVEKDLR
jgi:acyl-CoA synthetase (AMP-forming)/AMP-acid ligase II/acyl carrier protein